MSDDGEVAEREELPVPSRSSLVIKAPHLLRHFLGIICSRVYWLNPRSAVLLMLGLMALSSR